MKKVNFFLIVLWIFFSSPPSLFANFVVCIDPGHGGVGMKFRGGFLTLSGLPGFTGPLPDRKEMASGMFRLSRKAIASKTTETAKGRQIRRPFR